MNEETEPTRGELFRRSPFWVCLIIFLVLGVDYSYRLARITQQRRQLEGMQRNQAQVVTQFGQALSQQPQLEARLQALSLDLLQVSQTNAAAQQIVQEFKIAWVPGPAPAPAASSPSGK